MSVFDTLKREIEIINSTLERHSDCSLLSGLCESQNYSLTAGGKRIRPLLCLLVGRLFGAKTEDSLPYALALELVHTASLIHDDMPEIDDDDLRRGRATNHKVFGEACALLAGDGLFIDAFSLVSENTRLSERINLFAVRELSQAIGTEGLVGGEYIDVICEGREINLETLKTMHSKKTGALIRASAVLGALSAGVLPDDDKMRDVVAFAERIGLAFQIVDDVLDKVADDATLGKLTGADERRGKATYLSFYTPSEALSLAEKLTDEGLSYIEKYEGSETLAAFARELVLRTK